MKKLAYIAGQAVRLMLSAAAAFAAGYLMFDWMIQAFDPVSAVFVPAGIVG